MATKTCSICKIEKPLEEFWRDRNSKDGRTYYCIPCKKKYQKEKGANRYEVKKKYLLADKNKEKIKARAAVFKAKKRGELEQELCFVCDESSNAAHHLLYEFPLKVIWLCTTHHSEVHRQQKL